MIVCTVLKFTTYYNESIFQTPCIYYIMTLPNDRFFLVTFGVQNSQNMKNTSRSIMKYIIKHGGLGNVHLDIVAIVSYNRNAYVYKIVVLVSKFTIDKINNCSHTITISSQSLFLTILIMMVRQSDIFMSCEKK